MLKKCVTLILLLLSTLSNHATERSSGLRISLLTCSPGQELYSIFGHSALRIVDTAAGTDIVYNFGTFDFSDPDFYTKFVRGRLRYFLSQSSFPEFMYEYAYFKRPVAEQVLSIDEHEKQAIQQALFKNLNGENRFYRYDFLFDNCTTRLRDLIFTNGKNAAFPEPIAGKGTTFRDYLHVYLDKAQMPWTKLGIDMLLGAGADQTMDVKQSMFLPDPLMIGVKATSIGGNSLELEKTMLLDYPPVVSESSPSRLFTPFILFLFFFALVCWSSFSKSKWSGKVGDWTDLMLFGLSGIMGIVFLLAWFGTDHESFRFNLNLLWASPLNLLIFYQRAKSIQWFKKWLIINSLLIMLLCASFLVWPGIINPALFPLIIALSFRSWIYARS